MTLKLKWFSSSIVQRLRFVFMFIAAVLIAELAIGFIQMRALNNSVENLTESSVSVFLKTEESERGLKEILLLSQQLNAAKTLADLDPLQQRLNRAFDVVNTQTTALIQAHTGEIDSTGSLFALQDIEQGTQNILDAKKRFLTHNARITGLLKDLSATRTAISSALEEISFSAAISAETTLALSQDETPAFALRALPQLIDEFAQSNIRTSIRLETKSLIDRAMSLRSVTDAETLAELEQQLRFNLRGLVLHTSQLTPSDMRVDLAAEFLALRDILFSDRGLINSVSDKVEALQNLNTLLLDQSAPIEVISTLTNQLRRLADTEIKSANQNLAATTYQFGLITLLSTIAGLLLIASSLFYIVERQINQRMSRLTKAVLAIADGETAYDVKINGRDEIGKIAAALEVFKVNAKELSRSNAELEKFAYAAAHDLRTPMQAIQNLLDWTLEDDGNQFTDDGKSNMALMQVRIQRLGRLLNDLLEYSRVGQEVKNTADLSVAAMVEDIAQLVDPKGRFTVTTDQDFKTAQTYETPLYQILINLISNSIKHHDRDNGIITVQARKRANRIHISVSDDGPGIAPNYQDRIFGLFQTLRPRDEVEGSGLGLAIIRKLLDHYHGTIRVVSDPSTNRGTTFHFDVPETSSAQSEQHLAA